MLTRVLLLGVVSVATVLAGPAVSNVHVPVEPRFEGWNELVQGKGLFDESLNTIQAKSVGDELEQFKSLLSKEEILDNVYANYRKTYKELNDVSPHHKDLFEAQLYQIAAHNLEADSGKHTWWMAVNQFTDMTVSEMRAMTVDETYQPLNVTYKPYISVSGVAFPASKNYADEGKVSPVRNSKGGAPGTYFAAASVAESAYLIYTRQEKGFAGSVQQLVDCIPGFCQKYSTTCVASQLETSLIYIRFETLYIWNEYPYNDPPSVGACRQANSLAYLDRQNPYKVHGPNSDEQLMQLLVERGPVVLSLHFTNEMINNYGKGVYPGADCGSNAPNQDVVLVGYGTENGQDYWLIKNSWGRYWGVQGYLKLARNGNNVCQVLKTAVSVKHVTQ